MYILCKEINVKCNRKLNDNLGFGAYMEGFFRGAIFTCLWCLSPRDLAWMMESRGQLVYVN